MKWQDKMDAIVKDVLGIQFTCVVDSDNSFSIFENNDRIVQHWTIMLLKPHWRNQLSQVLVTIHKQKIQKALSKV